MSGVFTTIVETGVYIRNPDESNGAVFTGRNITQNTSNLNIVVAGNIGSTPTPGYSAQLRYTLSAANTTLPPVFGTAFTDNSDGTYTVSFSPGSLTTTDTYTVTISDTDNAMVTTNIVFNFVFEGGTTATFDTLTVEFYERNTDGTNGSQITIVEGEKTINVVVSGSLSGNAVSGELQCIQMTDPGDTSGNAPGLTFTDNGDGTYTTAYDTINLTENGSPYYFLVNSTCDSNVSGESPLVYVAENTVTTGTLVTSLEIISITRKDKDDNDVSVLNQTMYGSGDVEVTGRALNNGTEVSGQQNAFDLIVGGISKGLPPVDNQNGTYTWTHTVNSGAYPLSFRMLETASTFKSTTVLVLREPLKIQTIKLSGTLDYFSGGAADDALIVNTQYVNANETALLYVMGFDQNGNYLSLTTGNYIVNQSGATLTSTLDDNILTNQDGPYTVYSIVDAFVSTNADPVNGMPVMITNSGIEPTILTVSAQGVTSDPLTVYWDGVPAPDTVSLTDNDTHKSEFQAAAHFEARVADQYGNFIADRDVRIASSTMSLDAVMTVSQFDSTYYVYNNHTAVAGEVGATIGYIATDFGSSVVSSEFNVWWSDFYKVVLTGDGGNNTPNGTVTFTVTASDQYDNPVSGRTLTLTTANTSWTTSNLTDNGNGTYTYALTFTDDPSLIAGDTYEYTVTDDLTGVYGTLSITWAVDTPVATSLELSSTESDPVWDSIITLFANLYDQNSNLIGTSGITLTDGLGLEVPMVYSAVGQYSYEYQGTTGIAGTTVVYTATDQASNVTGDVTVNWGEFTQELTTASITVDNINPNVSTVTQLTFTIRGFDQNGDPMDYSEFNVLDGGSVGGSILVETKVSKGVYTLTYTIPPDYATITSPLEVEYSVVDKDGTVFGIVSVNYRLVTVPEPTSTVTFVDNSSPTLTGMVNFTAFVYDDTGATFDLNTLSTLPEVFLYKEFPGQNASLETSMTINGVTLTAMAVNPKPSTGVVASYFANTANSDYSTTPATVSWPGDTGSPTSIVLVTSDDSYSLYGNLANLMATVFTENFNQISGLTTVSLSGGQLPSNSLMQETRSDGFYLYSTGPDRSEDGTTVVYTATETSTGITASVEITWPSPDLNAGTLTAETSSVFTYLQGGVTFTASFTDINGLAINANSVSLKNDLYSETFPMVYSGVTGSYTVFLTAITSLREGDSIPYYALGSLNNKTKRVDLPDPISWPTDPSPDLVILTSSADGNPVNSWNSNVIFTATVTDEFGDPVDVDGNVTLTENPSVTNLNVQMIRQSIGVYTVGVTGTTGSAGKSVNYVATESEKNLFGENAMVSWYYQPAFFRAVLTVDDNTPDPANGSGQSLNFTARTFDEIGNPFDYSSISLVDTRGGITLGGFLTSQNTGEYTLQYPIPNEYLFTTTPFYGTYNLINSVKSDVLSNQIIAYLGSKKLSKFTLAYSSNSGPPANYKSVVRFDITSLDQYNDPISSGATGPDFYPKLFVLDDIDGEVEVNTSTSIGGSTTNYSTMIIGTVQTAGKTEKLFARDDSGVTGPIFNLTWPLPVITRTNMISATNSTPASSDTINLTAVLFDQFDAPYNQPNNSPNIFVYSRTGANATNTGVTMTPSGQNYGASVTDPTSGVGGLVRYSANNASKSYTVGAEVGVTWAVATDNVMSLTADTTTPAFLEYVSFRSYLFNTAGATLDIAPYSDETTTLYELANPQNTYTMTPIVVNNGQGTYFFYNLSQNADSINKRVDYGLIPLDGTTWDGITISVNWAAPSVNFAYTQLSCPSFVKQNNSYIVQHDIGIIPARTVDVRLFTPANQPYSGVTIPAGLNIRGSSYVLVPDTDGIYRNEMDIPIIDNPFSGGEFPYGSPDPMTIQHLYDSDFLQGTFGATLFYNGFVFDNSEIQYQEQANTQQITQIMRNAPQTFNYRIGNTGPSFKFVAKDVFSANHTASDISNFLGLTGRVTGEFSRDNNQSASYSIAGSSGLGLSGASGYSIQPYTISYGDMIQTESANFQIFTHTFNNASAQLTSPILPGKKATLGANTVLSYSPGPAGTVLNNGSPFIATISWQPVLSSMAQGGSTITSFSQTATWSTLQQSGLTFSVDSYLQPGTNAFIINLSFPVGGYTGTIPGLPAGSVGFTLTYADPTFEFFVNGSTETVLPRLVNQPVPVNLNYYTADIPPVLWSFPDPRFSIFYNSTEYPLVPSGTPGNFRVTSGIPLNTSEAQSRLLVKARGSAPTDSEYAIRIITYSDVGVVSSGPIPCFLADAPILTPSGNVRIDSLKTGDVLVTNKGFGFVKNLRSYKVPAAPHTNPYLIPMGTYGASQDLLISPLHGVQIGKDIIAAKDLGLEQVKMSGNIHYFNVELDKWDNMYVAGVEVESLAPPAWAAIVDSLALVK